MSHDTLQMHVCTSLFPPAHQPRRCISRQMTDSLEWLTGYWPRKHTTLYARHHELPPLATTLCARGSGRLADGPAMFLKAARLEPDSLLDGCGGGELKQICRYCEDESLSFSKSPRLVDMPLSIIYRSAWQRHVPVVGVTAFDQVPAPAQILLHNFWSLFLYDRIT